MGNVEILALLVEHGGMPEDLMELEYLHSEAEKTGKDEIWRLFGRDKED
jgi:hypothetical protein